MTRGTVLDAMNEVRSYFDIASLMIETLGILASVAGGTVAVVNFTRDLRKTRFLDAYQEFRRSLARAILIGLVFLIAGDIIGTVVVAPTLSNVLAACRTMFVWSEKVGQRGQSGANLRRVSVIRNENLRRNGPLSRFCSPTTHCPTGC